MTDCIFCTISSGKFNTDFIYEDDDVQAFADISPKAKYHYLIIPREHIATLNDATNAQAILLGKMMLAAKKIAAQLGCDASGYRTIMNCNKDGGQEVFHIHLHLLGGEPLRGF
jgi:histidine triad (HIT) family protein